MVKNRVDELEMPVWKIIERKNSLHCITLYIGSQSQETNLTKSFSLKSNPLIDRNFPYQLPNSRNLQVILSHTPPQAGK